MLRNALLIGAALCLAHPCEAQYAAANSSRGVAPAKIASVQVDLTTTRYTIPSNFVGISIENQIMITMGLLNSSQTSLINLIKLLGSNGIIRIGGTSSDSSTSTPALTSQLATNLAGFISALGNGWTTIYGLNIRNSSSGATAASQASTIATALGTSNVTFQFGNEPIDDAFFTPSTYATRWNVYYTAVTGAVASVKLASWDDGNFGQTQTAINALTPGVSGLNAVTQHFYNGPCGQIQAAQPILSSPAFNDVNFGQSVYFNKNKAWAGNVPLLLTETGPICGGTVTPSGSTDRLMATAWYVAMAITLADDGWAGMQSHEFLACSTCYFTSAVAPNGNSYYNPLWLNADGTFQAGAIFYGMYLFSKIQGQQALAAAIGGNSALKAIATKGAGGNANILAVNLDAGNPITVTPNQSSAWTTANVLQVKGAGGCSEASPTVGGAVIGPGGSWSGSAVSINNGQSITLGPCEAALIQIQP